MILINEVIKVIKKLTFFILSMVLALMVFAVHAEETKKQKIKYAALGDSIATGYALPDYTKSGGSANAYTTLVKNTLPEIYGGAEVEYTSLSVNGLTTDGLYNKLKSNPDVIKNADIITVSIGSNDILNVFNSIINKNLSGIDTSVFDDAGSAEALKGAYEQMNIIKNEFIGNAELNGVCDAYIQKLSRLYALIRDISPNAQVYFTNIYNPFGKSALFGMNMFDLADPYIKKMNSAFNSSEGYYVADVYSAFASSGANVTNVQDDFKSFDPHPNINGHKIISAAVIEKISANNAKIHKVFNSLHKAAENPASPDNENFSEEVFADDNEKNNDGALVRSESFGVSAVKFIGVLLNAAEIFKVVF